MPTTKNEAKRENLAKTAMELVLRKLLKNFISDYQEIYKRAEQLQYLFKPSQGFRLFFPDSFDCGWNSCMLYAIEAGVIPKVEDSKPFESDERKAVAVPDEKQKKGEKAFDDGWKAAIDELKNYPELFKEL